MKGQNACIAKFQYIKGSSAFCRLNHYYMLMEVNATPRNHLIMQLLNIRRI